MNAENPKEMRSISWSDSVNIYPYRRISSIQLDAQCSCSIVNIHIYICCFCFSFHIKMLNTNYVSVCVCARCVSVHVQNECYNSRLATPIGYSYSNREQNIYIYLFILFFSRVWGLTRVELMENNMVSSSICDKL